MSFADYARAFLRQNPDVILIGEVRDEETAAPAAGVRLVPRLGLTSWAAFKRMGDHAMVMGDLVLREEQVNPVMSAALDAGLEVTALHNHFLGDSPRVMFMHLGGHGPVDKLATAVGAVFRAMRTPPEKPAPAAKAASIRRRPASDPRPSKRSWASRGISRTSV